MTEANEKVEDEVAYEKKWYIIHTYSGYEKKVAADLEKRIDKLVSKGERIKCEIINEIDNIDDPRYCEILEAYFIDCMDMEDIADNMGYGLRHTYKLYSDAITQLLNYDNDKSLK